MKKRALVAVPLLALLAVFAATNLSCATVGCATQGPNQLTAADGVCLQTYALAPEPQPRASVVVVHGLRDHAVRYQPLADALKAKNMAVYAVDLHGHGRSGGARQRFESIEQLVEDVRQVVKVAKTEHPGVPVFLYGHSLGGLITTTYGLEHPEDLAGFILSAPGIKLKPDVTSGQVSAARFFGAVLPGLPAQPLGPVEDFTSNPEERVNMTRDPLIVLADLPARSTRAAIDGIEAVQARAEEVKLPMLVMHGDADLITNIDGSRELVKRAASTDKTLVLWEGQHHDLMHEPKHDEVIAKAVEWVEAHALAR
ncbi:MAG: lysophospholipase [Myxococcaceae bacterium]|nr:lysophospholipase [Myxococcaceae bacterium]